MEDIIGKRVVFKNDFLHVRIPEFYPTVGTIGTVVGKAQFVKDCFYIRWTKGTTSGNDEWHCSRCDFEIKSCIECV